MESHKADGPEHNAAVGDEADENAAAHAGGDGYDSTLATAATVAVVGAGVLIFEAALLPGLVLGIATMMVPQHLPKIGALVNPLVKSTLRVAYKAGQKTKEIFARWELETKCGSRAWLSSPRARLQSSCVLIDNRPPVTEADLIQLSTLLSDFCIGARRSFIPCLRAYR